MFATAFTACSLVSLLAVLLFFLCGMFSHNVALEIRGLGALVVAVITGKRLLTSVGSRVIFQIASCYARKVTLTTFKRPLS